MCAQISLGGRLGDETFCFVGTHQKREGHRSYGPGSKFFTFYGLKLSVESQLLGVCGSEGDCSSKTKRSGHYFMEITSICDVSTLELRIEGQPLLF